MAAAPDPYEPYLRQADQLYAGGDIIKAGQIWQAILKKVPGHGEAMAGLRKVKLHFDARATQEGAQPPAAPRPTETQEAQLPVPRPAEVRVSEAEAPTSTRSGLPGGDPEISDLLNQGCVLYDAGHLEDARKRWERILLKDPDHAMARGYINMARKALDMPLLRADGSPDQGTTGRFTAEDMPVRPQVSDPEPVPQVASTEDMEALLRQGCTLFDMGQVEEALAKWNRVLAQDPSNRRAWEYAQEAHRQLGLNPLPPLDAEPQTDHPLHGGDASNRLDRAVEAAVQLFDMGMVEEAIARWREVLDEDPTHAGARGYLEMAQRGGDATANSPDLTSTAALPKPPEDPEMLRNLLHTAGILLKAQRYPEAVEAFHRVLSLSPDHAGALQGLQQARAFTQAEALEREALAAPLPPPPPPEPEPAEAEVEAQPPAAVVTPVPAPVQRQGLTAPRAVQGLNLPEALKSPKVQVAVAAGVLVLIVAAFGIHAWRREVRLAGDRSDALRTATAEATREAKLVPLEIGATQLKQEAQASLPDDPLAAYCLAQQALRLQPEEAALAALVSQAKGLLAARPVGEVEDPEALLQKGDLEAALKASLARLAQAPDDQDLRHRAGRLCLAMAQLYAGKERWGDARDVLKTGRALFPSERIWRARLLLLDQIQALPKADRPAWISFLG